MAKAEQLITENLDLWSSAVKAKSSAGRGSSKKLELYGIQKLRNLIIQLAVDGKLVTQHSNDTAACELIREIALEKEKRFKTRKTNKQASIKSDTDLHASATLPNHWEYTRLGNLINLISGQHLKPTEFSGKKDSGAIPYLTGPAEFGELYPEPSRYTHKRMSVAQKGDILITCKGSGVGKTNLANQEIFISRQLMAIEPILISSKFLLLLVESLNDYFRSNIVGIAIPGISRSDVLDAVVALPPLAEQHRIVAKVDELMSLCDQLEEEQENNLETHETLVSTLLGALTSAAADASQFTETWQRIQDNFDILFTTERSVDQLKRTILQLAIIGKLAPQDPEDEPAETLLSRISEEREDLITHGVLKKQKKISNTSTETDNWSLPKGWALAFFGDVLFNRDSERVPLSVETRKTRRGKFDYYGASGIIDSIDDFIFEKTLLLIGEDGANLISRSTPIAFIARGKYWVNNHAHVLDGISETLLLYVCLHINAISLEPYVTGTAQPKMNQAKMNSIPLRIPPEKEQQRIILKVGELLALCDQLKATLSSAQETQLILADSIVEQAIHSPA